MDGMHNGTHLFEQRDSRAGLLGGEQTDRRVVRGILRTGSSKHTEHVQSVIYADETDVPGCKAVRKAVSLTGD